MSFDLKLTNVIKRMSWGTKVTFFDVDAIGYAGRVFSNRKIRQAAVPFSRSECPKSMI